MKFGQILSAVKINSSLKEFSELSEVPVDMFDRKNRKVESINYYPEGIFFNNPWSLRNFINMLEELIAIHNIPNTIVIKLTDSVLFVTLISDDNKTKKAFQL